MAHFAKVENGIVVEVIVAEQAFIDQRSLRTGEQWVQTSYNTKQGIHYDPVTGLPSEDQSKALRKNFAGKGFLYLSDFDMFIPPKPYPSWSLNETIGQWEAPIPQPEDGYAYEWDEANQTWEQMSE